MWLLDTTDAIANNKAMRLRRVFHGGSALLFLALVLISVDGNVQALQSTNYRFDETAIGTSNILESSSDNFSVNPAIGDLGIGNAVSDNFQVEAGTRTDPDPVLSFSVDTASADFGSFSAGSTATAETTFSVTNYTSYGYVVIVEGSPPTNGSHVIEPLTTTSAPTIGTEQFGINLVANTLPTSIGANPANGSFGFGIASPNYDIPNQFRFVNGDIIAEAPRSSGKTTYTISYIVNVEPLTPGGRYDSNQTIIVTGTY